MLFKWVKFKLTMSIYNQHEKYNWFNEQNSMVLDGFDLSQINYIWAINGAQFAIMFMSYMYYVLYLYTCIKPFCHASYSIYIYMHQCGTIHWCVISVLSTWLGQSTHLIAHPYASNKTYIYIYAKYIANSLPFPSHSQFQPYHCQHCTLQVNQIIRVLWSLLCD